MEERKYELVKGNYTEIDGRTLYRIKALRDFGDVKKGDLGGYIEKEDNLSHEGNCWIYNDAMVYDNASVFGDAMVYDNANISGNASVFGDAMVYDNANVSGNAKVYENAVVHNHAVIHNDAKVYGNAGIFNDAKVYGKSQVHGDAVVFDNAKIYDTAEVINNARLSGRCNIYGDTIISGCSMISLNADISNSKDYISIDNFGGSKSTTFFMCKDGVVRFQQGNITGKLDEFIKLTEPRSESCSREWVEFIKIVKKHFNVGELDRPVKIVRRKITDELTSKFISIDDNTTDYQLLITSCEDVQFGEQPIIVLSMTINEPIINVIDNHDLDTEVTSNCGHGFTTVHVFSHTIEILKGHNIRRYRCDDDLHTDISITRYGDKMYVEIVNNESYQGCNISLIDNDIVSIRDRNVEY